jgi:hypothetical protein
MNDEMLGMRGGVDVDVDVEVRFWRFQDSSVGCVDEEEEEDMDVRGLICGVWEPAGRRDGVLKLKERLKISLGRRFLQRLFAHSKGLAKGLRLGFGSDVGVGAVGLEDAMALRISCSSWRMIFL